MHFLWAVGSQVQLLSLPRTSSWCLKSFFSAIIADASVKLSSLRLVKFLCVLWVLLGSSYPWITALSPCILVLLFYLLESLEWKLQKLSWLLTCQFRMISIRQKYSPSSKCCLVLTIILKCFLGSAGRKKKNTSLFSQTY